MSAVFLIAKCSHCTYRLVLKYRGAHTDLTFEAGAQLHEKRPGHVVTVREAFLGRPRRGQRTFTRRVVELRVLADVLRRSSSHDNRRTST